MPPVKIPERAAMAFEPSRHLEAAVVATVGHQTPSAAIAAMSFASQLAAALAVSASARPAPAPIVLVEGTPQWEPGTLAS